MTRRKGVSDKMWVITGVQSCRVTENTRRDSTSDSFSLYGPPRHRRPVGKRFPRSGRRWQQPARVRHRVSSGRLSRRAPRHTDGMLTGQTPSASPGFKRMATERRCASSPSTDASVMAAGARARNWSGPKFQHRSPFDKIEHRKSAREPRRPGRRQHMVGAADIIADDFRRVAAQKDCTGIADTGHIMLPDRHGQFKMLGCYPVGERLCGFKVARTRMIAPKSRQLCAAIAPRGNAPSCRSTALFDGHGRKLHHP